jgi:hypothetical protein
MVEKASIPLTPETQAITLEIEAARAEYQKANAVFQRKFNALQKRLDRESAKVPMDLTNALVVYTTAGEHSAGHKWLSERTWKGDWAGTFIMFMGCYSPATNQRELSVAVPRDLDEAKLQATLAAMPEVIGALLPGFLVREDKFTQYADYRALKVFYSGEGQAYLVERDGVWGVVMPYERRYGSDKNKIQWLVEGLDLEAALRWIGANLPYGSDSEEEDDDGYGA